MGGRHVLVLTAADGVGDAAGVAAAGMLAAHGLRAAPPRRLAATAVEVGFAGGLPPDFDAQALVDAALGGAAVGGAAVGGAAVGGAAVDANVVPADGRRKRVLIADMDSTIIGVECIDELADFAGLKAEISAVTEAAMRGELDFEAALTARVALLAGLEEGVLARAYAERVRLNPGARVLVATMAALGAATALISGGFSYFTERVAAAAGFAEHRANRLEVEAGRLTGRVASPILGRAAKRVALGELCARAGVGEDAAVAVGDGANDLDMVAAAGLGVAYRAKPALAAAADARLARSDLTAVLALQGIPEAEWRG